MCSLQSSAAAPPWRTPLLAPLASQLNFELAGALSSSEQGFREARSAILANKLAMRLDRQPAGAEMLDGLVSRVIPALCSLLDSSDALSARACSRTGELADELVPDSVAEALSPTDLASLLVCMIAIGLQRGAQAPAPVSARGAEAAVDSLIGLFSSPQRRPETLLHASVGQAIETLRVISSDPLDITDIKPRSHSGIGAARHPDLVAAYALLIDRVAALVDRTDLSLNPDRASAARMTISSLSATGPTIRIVGDCHDFEVHLSTMEGLASLRAELLTLHRLIQVPYVSADGASLQTALPYHIVDDQIVAHGYRPWQLGFTVETQATLTLLSTLYGSKYVAIRELVQNALDACLLRSHLIGGSEPYAPAITVTLDRRERRLTVSDNGLGIPRRVLETSFGRVGASYYRSQQLMSMAPRYAPIGHFGIGLLSCFMLARSLTLRTAATAGEGLSLRLADPNSLFRVIEFSATEPGTTVEIELLADLDVNLEALVRHYAPAAGVPIHINVDGKQETFLRQPGTPSDWRSHVDAVSRRAEREESHERLMRLWPQQRGLLTEAIATAQFDDYQLTATVITPSSAAADPDRLLWLSVPGMHLCTVTNRGILVFQDRKFGIEYDEPGESNAVVSYGAHLTVNLLRHVPELPITRDSLKESPWTATLRRRLRELIVTTVEQHARAAADTDVPTLQLRAYLYQLLVSHTGTGVAHSTHYKEEPNFRARDIHNAFSVDKSISGRFARIYCSLYPVAWKTGSSVRFATVDQVLAECPEALIEVCLADPRYPQFRGAARPPDVRLAVVDDAREASLICDHVASAGPQADAVFTDGWRSWTGAGLHTVTSSWDDRLPPRTAVAEIPFVSSDIIVFSLETGLGGQHLSAASSPEISSPDGTPLHVINHDNGLVRWLLANAEEAVDAQEAFLKLLALRMEDPMLRGFSHTRKRDKDPESQLVSQLLRTCAMYDGPPLTKDALKFGFDLAHPHERVPRENEWPVIGADGRILPSRVQRNFTTRPEQRRWWASS